MSTYCLSKEFTFKDFKDLQLFFLFAQVSLQLGGKQNPLNSWVVYFPNITQQHKILIERKQFEQ